MADDLVKTYLDGLNTSDTARASAWNAVYDSTDSEDLVKRLAKMPFSDKVRSQLWELKYGHGEMMEAPTAPPEAPASAGSRFASNLGATVNPVTMAQGLWNALPIPQALGGAGVIQGPLNTAKGIYNASAEQLGKAKEEFGQGHLIEAAGHTMGAIPLIGPAAAAAGEQIQSGDVAGGLGTGLGLVLTAGAPTVIKGGAKLGAKMLPGKAAIAGKLEAGAAGRVAEVMSPTVGPNKARFGNMAEKVAPELLKRGDVAGLSREAFTEHIGGKLTQSEQALDAAADARLAARSFETKPLIDALKKKRLELTAEAVEGSKPAQVVTERTSSILDESGKPIKVAEAKTQPIGRDVVPGPNSARVAMIDQAIAELEQLGPVTRYDPIRLIRQAYDGPAKAVYSPSMTADFLKAQGGKLGAADVTGTLREALAQWDQPTAAANVDYALYRTSDDVLQATAEVERTRPKAGRAIMARLTGAVVGGQTGGAQGAVAGFVFGPALEAALGSGATTKLQTAKLMTRLAKAIRKGDEGHVASLVSQLKALAKAKPLKQEIKAGVRSASTVNATNPNESQSLQDLGLSTP